MNSLTRLTLLLFPLTLAGCNLLPQKYIHTEIAIDAPPEAVWNTLIDLPNYPHWNPYHVRVEGETREGSVLEVEIHKPNGTQLIIHPRMQRIDSNRELTWGGGISGIFTGKHQFILKPEPDFRTRLIHKERFVGLAVPFASLEAIEEGYQQMNQALKETVESHYSAKH